MTTKRAFHSGILYNIPRMERLMMRGLNIYKRKDGRYEGRITRGKASNGKRLYQYFFGRTKQAIMYPRN